MADEIFENPRLAAIYDALDPDRSDLDLYVDFASGVGASRILDIGCGTGTLAVLLARRGFEVVGIDPARSCVDVARGKRHAELVTWIHGYTTDVVEDQFDLVTMTGNVAQAIVDPGEWNDVLTSAHRLLRAGGYLVFESRDPADRAWERWNRRESYSMTEIAGVGRVESWVEALSVALPMVTFRWTWAFDDGDTLTSRSTLRFRVRDELVADLQRTGFSVEAVRDAPDRPGRELVLVGRRST